MAGDETKPTATAAAGSNARMGMGMAGNVSAHEEIGKRPSSSVGARV
jgi:hypothetical protein